MENRSWICFFLFLFDLQNKENAKKCFLISKKRNDSGFPKKNLFNDSHDIFKAAIWLFCFSDKTFKVFGSLVAEFTLDIAHFAFKLSTVTSID